MATAHPRNNFTALRLLAAFMVLYTHMFAVSGRPEPTLIPGIGFGSLAVMMFFVISGYLVTASWRADPSVPRFLKRRVLRLWPAMAVTFLITMLIVAPWVREQSLTELFQLKQYTKAFGNLFFYPNYRTFDAFSNTPLPIAAINGSLWTIPLEFMCYLLVMLLALVSRNRLAIALGGTLAISVIAFVALGGQAWFSAVKHPSTWYYLAHYGTFFIMGGLLNIVPQLIRPRIILPAILLGAALFMLEEYVLTYLITIPLLTLWVGTSSWPGLNKLDDLGDYSYGVYLYAWPVQQLVTLSLGTSASIGTLLVCSAILTLACGAFSWHLLEKPLLAFKPRRRPLA